jgi:hypothetical protein
MQKAMSEEELILYIEALRPRLLIDRNALDVECQKQAAFFEEVAGLLPALKCAAKVAKGHFEFVRAELEVDVRRNPAKYMLEKVTDKALASMVVVQADYQNAQKAQYSAEERANRLEACVMSVADRKSMLRDLVVMWEKDYYAHKQGAPMSVEQKKVNDSHADKYVQQMRDGPGRSVRVRGQGGPEGSEVNGSDQEE